MSPYFKYQETTASPLASY